MRAAPILTAALIPLMLGACTAGTNAPETATATATAAAVAAPEAEPLYVRRTMQAEVNPAIVAIWDVGNNAMNETGGLDAALMSAERWTQLASAAGDMAAAGDKMAGATNIQAASAGNMATEDYEVSMANVQSYIDADPQGFRDMAANFAQLSRSLEAAAQAGDVDVAGDLVARMDVECSVCHAKYWYAEAE